MASKLNYSTALRNLKMDAITTAVGNGGIVKVYDNSAPQPAGPGTAVPGGSILLATITCATPFAPGASSGVLSPTLPANVNGAATGTQLWFRLYQSNGTTAVVDGSAGISGCDMNMSGTVITGQPIQVTSWTFTDNNAGH